jgi:Domain of unknown function (DUF222)
MVADLDVPQLSPAALLSGLHAHIDALLALDLPALSVPELLDTLRETERAIRRLPAARHAAVAQVRERGVAAEQGCRSVAAFLRQIVNCSAGEAGSWLAQADDLVPGRALSTGEELLPRLPVLADAVAAGEVSPDQVRLIRHALRRIPAGVDEPTRVAAEETLVARARVLDPVQLSRACARLLQCVDPDGSLGSTPEERRARRGFTIGRQDRHGMYPVSGLLDPETGALLQAALEPVAAPRHTAEERDPRTAAQRHHDAVRDAAKLLLGGDCLPSQSGLPATLLLTARLDDLEARTGLVSTAHGGLVPVEDVIRIAARAAVVPIVFDTDGAPLWLGRTRRLATAQQRLLLAAMDRGCVYPGCDAPAIRTEVMHLTDWAHGGATDIDGLALGCDYHHHRLDDWKLERRGGRVWCIPPPWIDPHQEPRINTVFHDPELPIPPPHE